MAIELCTTFCTPVGHQYAGVEFGRGRIGHMRLKYVLVVLIVSIWEFCEY